MSISANRRAWLLAPTCVLLTLGLSAIVLWFLLPHAYPQSFSGGGDSAPLAIPGQAFTRAPAAAWLADASGEASKLAAVPGRTVLRAGVELDAGAFPQLELELAEFPPGTRLHLLWRSGQSGGGVFSTELTGVTEGSSWHSLADRTQWKGAIVEIGLIAVGGPQRSVPRVAGAHFHGAGRRALIERLKAQWTRFEPWRMGSLNRYAGARGDVILHPAGAFMAWSALALMLFLALARYLRLPRSALAAGALLVLFLPWMGLDRLWQAQLEGQLAATHDRFGGLTQAEKHEREMDVEIQHYAERLERIFPKRPEHRIFLLHSSKGHNFWRLRLQFHLLPRNIYNFGLALLSEMRAGDHVLVLGEIDRIRYDEAQGVLSDGERAWRAQLVDRSAYGRVFRLEERVESAPDEEGG